MAEVTEEHSILRVTDPDLAGALRECLDTGTEEDVKSAKIVFEDSDQHGSFVFRGKPYPLKVLNLPCVAETYKTYDDVNLVKSGDVGQVLVVGDAVPLEGPPGESRDGITRPMRNARERIFRQALDVEPEIVSKVEMDLLTILAGGAPPGMQFVDYEEVWQVNPETGVGEWVPATKQKA
ncbi:hypothetical protein ACKKBG_A20985 [Auxenochlorella protothecoides x Auxenochlorella symbiontica]|uniref:TAFII55 protein conserved region domain-containing protein n=1 Tax=Auxenochlorella protothecoides TaxID=3075 RepID=A0A087SKK3_AUXPR|nr:hypothetical protein F751_4750 [Auxenochlorella protothecoides]KFM26257.1 hypothetical protein F751_4750 [Auxenochlorella protothecoides]RMZ56659.1 hypothetical protein APUTEX25_002748 [Auxenochlorella protothecoides]|eukprot:RMZ56659.1 hypothetical protein APUTEX25_002748 [Auxenochlorella protothecoides]